MKMIVLALAASLSACAPSVTVPAGPGGVIARADTVILTGERGFAAAELAYITAANGVGRLVDAGLIKGATATRVRAWNSEARGLLVTGKATADAAAKARAAARLFTLAGELNALTGVN